MKNLFLFVLLLSQGLFFQAKAQHHFADWHKYIDGHETSKFNNILFDGTSIIVNGFWMLDASFQEIDLPYFLGSNTLLVKMDTLENVLWNTTITGDGYENFYDIALDSENNIIAVGWSSSDSPIEINGEVVYTPTIEWSARAVVAKFSGIDGSLIWYKTFGADEPYYNITGTRMALDDEDNIYIGGYHNQSFFLDDFEVIYNQDAYAESMFIAKLDSEGTAQWAKSIDFVSDGAGGLCSPKSLVYSDGFLFVGAEYSKPLIINDEPLPYLGENYWLTLLKMNEINGDFDGVIAFGSPLGQGLTRMAVDLHGNIVVGGWFDSDNNSLQIRELSVDGYGVQDGFLAKFSPDLDPIWLKDMGSQFASRVFNVKIDEDNRIFVGGGFDSYTSFLYDNQEVIERRTPNSLSKFQLVIDQNANFQKGFALYGENIFSRVDYADFVITPGDILYTVGSSVDSIFFLEDQPFFSIHDAAYITRWDMNGDPNALRSITFFIRDQAGNHLENAIITLNGVEHNENVYHFPGLEQGVYDYSVSLSGYFTAEGSLELELINLVETVVMTVDDTNTYDLQEASLLIYPNPASDNIHIRSTREVMHLMVFDLEGREILSMQPKTEQVILNVSGLKNGLYILKVLNPAGVTTEKFQVLR